MSRKVDLTDAVDVLSRIAEIHVESEAWASRALEAAETMGKLDAERDRLAPVAARYLGGNAYVVSHVYDPATHGIGRLTDLVLTADGGEVACHRRVTALAIEPMGPEEAERLAGGGDRVRLKDGRTLDVTVDQLAAAGAMEAAAAEFHLPAAAPHFVFDGNGEVS